MITPSENLYYFDISPLVKKPLPITWRITAKGEMKAFYELSSVGAAVNDRGYTGIVLDNQFIAKYLRVNERACTFMRYNVKCDCRTRDEHHVFVRLLLNQLIGDVEETGYHFDTMGQDSLFLFERGKLVGVLMYSNFGKEQRLRFVGCPVVAEKMIEICQEHDQTKPSISTGRLALDKEGNVRDYGKPLKSRRTVKDPKAFWPHAPLPPAEMAAAFEASDSSVLILYGEPGLGKSQYIAEMIKWKDANSPGTAFICDDKPVFQSPQFTPFVHDLVDGSWLITEDAHEMIASREDGNSLMSGILNAAEGLTSGNVKFIISTNITSLRDVDTALYRPGRTFRVIPFKTLNVEQANAARVAIGFEPIDFGDKTKLSLAEALNWEAYTALQKEVTQTGFIGR